MSLDWDATAMDPAKKAEVFPPDANGKMSDHLHCLIFTTMVIDIGHITEANAPEVWFRVNLRQQAIGTLFNQWTPMASFMFPPDTPESERGTWNPLLLTPIHIDAAIGLRTNVADTTRTRWMKRFVTEFARVNPYSINEAVITEKDA